MMSVQQLLHKGTWEMLENWPGWVPHLGAPENQVVDFVKRICNYKASYRQFHMKRMSRNLLFRLGYQWLDDDPGHLVGSNGYYFYRSYNSDVAEEEVPTPVTNYTEVAIDNAHARIGKKKWTFKVMADKGTPRIRAAAQLAQDILRSKLRKQNWDDKQDLAIEDAVTLGTTALLSRFDLSIMQEMTAPVEAAMVCAKCGKIVSSTEIPVEYKERVLSTDSIESMDRQSLKFKACPFCGGPLQPIDLTPSQAEFDVDAFERPLGFRVPKGEPLIENVSPFELFPENAGLYTDPNGMRTVGWMRPVDLYWLLERYPDNPVVEELTPASGFDLMRLHPIFGEYAAGRPYNVTVEAGVLDNHVLVQEVIVKPFAEKITTAALKAAEESGFDLPGREGDVVVNDGRYYLCACDKVIEQGPLLMQYMDHTDGTRKMPKILMGVARYKTRRGEFWGSGIPDSIASLQNRVNSIDAQHTETGARMGSPNLIATEEMDIRGPEWREGGPAGCKIMLFTKDVTDPRAKPEILEGRTLPAIFWQIRDRYIQDIQICGEIQDIELGDVPPNLRTTSGLVLTGENAAARRGSRERALMSMFKAVAKHQLQLLCTLRTERDTYEVDAKGASATTVRYFRGAELMEQYNVEIDTEAGVDPDIYLREATFEALQTGLYAAALSNPVVRKRVLKQAGLPEVDDLDNCQVALAEQVTYDFSERGIIHRPESTIEDPWIFYQILGQFWLQHDKIKLMKERALWNDEILPKLADWEKDLVDLEMRAAATEQAYGKMPPEQAVELWQNAVQQERAVMEQYRGAVAQAEQAGQPIPPQPQVMVPPEPVYIPHALEERIMLVWNERLGLPTSDPGIESPMPGEAPSVLDKLLEFSSVLEAYRIYADRRKMQVAAGGPVLAAPGSASAPGGIEPSPGIPAQGAAPVAAGGAS